MGRSIVTDDIRVQGVPEMLTAKAPRSRARNLRLRFPTRSLHLIDIENLVGHGRASEEELASAASRYIENVRVVKGDLIVIGCDRGLRLDIGLAWPGVRVVGGTGKDGAEKALLADISAAAMALRFSQVVVGSGDHAFAGLVRDLRALGTVVGVLSPAGALARELALAASWSRCFCEDSDAAPRGLTRTHDDECRRAV
jgi:NYN domain